MPPIRLGLTAVFLDDQVAFLQHWRAYLEAKLGRRVEFVQRGRYRETIELLQSGHLDAAWICGFPYVRYRRELRLVAVPVFEGKPLYRSYLIVPASDRSTRSILDLQGRMFAFSDPDSNSGFLYPTYQLYKAGARGESFFSRSFFTWAHRKVVEAVAAGLAHGGAVDGYVWETLHLASPELASRTRVADKSPEFGHPPIAARASLGLGEVRALQIVLTGMSGDAEGRALLTRLNLDGFTAGNDGLFSSIDRMRLEVFNG
ncbi:MAG: ABC transporter substrate-binding protein [Betaproteobacteria bacterium RIFCSPLOWO2_02_FULL_62_17]|nr:MAG: ABC transporter substrate-binding protein [Betaproteobacteria bacterium RIFCSPLOWO2_02_FULL_62_17]